MAGTAESAWQVWPELAALPALDLAGCRRAVVAAAHPDDEALGAGGLIATLLAQGADVHVVTATDGEASHPGSPTVGPTEMARIRRAEAAAALAVLGEGLPAELTGERLGLPDGAVATAQPALMARLAAALAPADWCFATWVRDGHPDHEAVGRAAVQACRQVGAAPPAGFPIWTWHWAVPADSRVPWDRADRLTLSPSAQARKAAAVACYVSQLSPLSDAPADAAVVPPHMLAHFTRTSEVFFR